jgi:hypothetical protein
MAQPVIGIFVLHADENSSLVHLKMRSNFLGRKYVCHVVFVKKQNTLSKLFLRE